MKKLLVLLLCALAVFAIVSCKNDPKPEPTPTFKVTFDSQGGSAVAAATVEKDAKVAKPADPTKLGAAFGGWYTEAACENEYNFDTAVTKDFTLYAKWTVLPPAKIAQLTVTTDITAKMSDNEKVQLQWDLREATGSETAGIVSGDVITVKYRSTRDDYQHDIRTNKKVIDKSTGAAVSKDVRWVYQEYTGTLQPPVLGEDGWYTLTYTFSDDYYTKKDKPEYDKYQYYNLGVNFQAYWIKGDIFEVKEATYTHDGTTYKLVVTQDNVISKATCETIDDHEWTIPKTYAVVYGTKEPGYDGDNYPKVEAVEKGGKATGLKDAGYKFEYFSDEAKTKAFDFNTEINADTIVYYTKTTAVYKLTSTMAGDDPSGVGERFQIRWKPYETKEGDVIAFKYKPDADNITKFSVRGDVDWAKAVDIPAGEKDADGYYSFSYTIPSGTSTYFFFALYDYDNTVGNVLRIKDITFNDVKLDIADANIYGGCKPTLVVE